MKTVNEKNNAKKLNKLIKRQVHVNQKSEELLKMENASNEPHDVNFTTHCTGKAARAA